MPKESRLYTIHSQARIRFRLEDAELSMDIDVVLSILADLPSFLPSMLHYSNDMAHSNEWYHGNTTEQSYNKISTWIQYIHCRVSRS